MIWSLVLCATCFAALLMLSTLVQMMYMDMLRLRPKENAFLEKFRDGYSDRIGLKYESGALIFSLLKHSMLALTGVIACGSSALGQTFSWTHLLEAAIAGWGIMIVSTYVVPPLLYRHTGGGWFAPFLPLVKVLAIVTKPLAAVLTFLQSLAQLGDKEESRDDQNSSEEDIEALITAGTEEGIIEEEDRKLIQSVVAFGDKIVREVMTPRPSMVAISEDATLEELRKLVIHEQFSRIPVYSGSIDNVTGFLHVRDMFELDHAERQNKHTRDLVRPMRVVPESKPVHDLLREMQREGNHMAIVVDEYGNTAGVITMEDLVEEIVGEIRDEHEPGLDVEPDPDGGFIVSGSFDVDHLEDLVEFRCDECASTTVGGLATEWLGHVPHVGESVVKDGLRIEVLASNDLRVDQVRVSRAEVAGA